MSKIYIGGEPAEIIEDTGSHIRVLFDGQTEISDWLDRGLIADEADEAYEADETDPEPAE